MKMSGRSGPWAYGRLIQFCTDNQLFCQGKQLHARLIIFSVTPDNYLGSKLIFLYSKSGNMLDARHIFDKILHKNIFSWNALLLGYSHRNMHADMLKLFSSLVCSNETEAKPDKFTISCVLKAQASVLSEPMLAKEVHCFVLRRGFDWDIFVVNALITYYSRCGELRLARTVFDNMPERDIVSWNSMLAGYSQGGFYEDCKELFRDMSRSEQLRPNRMTVVSVLQACGQSGDLNFGMEVHKLVKENGIEMDLLLYNAVIGFYAKSGSLDCARELFEEMREKDEVTYGSMISGYMVQGFVDKALNLFKNVSRPALSTWNSLISGLVQNKKHDRVLDLVRDMQAQGFRPNTVTLSSVLPVFSHFPSLKGAKEIHAYAIRNFFDGNIYVSTAIIDSYAKSGFICGAHRIFDLLTERSLIVCTAIISAYAAHGDANMALCLFDEMLDDGIQPDAVTFTAVLASCAHSGLVDEAWKVYNAMLPKYGIQPLDEHYACMVGVLSRAGKLSEAVEFILKMSSNPSVKVWGALLNGASVASDVEVGEFVCARLFEIEPENAANYVVMANLYSQAGRWEEADKTRERMETVGLKKIPGSSWIEYEQRLEEHFRESGMSESPDERRKHFAGIS